MALEGALRFPTAFDVLAHQAEGVEVAESELRNPVLAGLAVRQLNLPGDALLLTLTRGDEVTVPHGDDLLRLGDRLSVVGSPDAVKQAIQLMEPTAGSFT
jgi:Trk K+ transport system NAD-binding subunit